MKNVIFIFIATVFAIGQMYAQTCTPRTATGSPGIQPVTDSLPCAVVGEPYDTTIYVENFANQTVGPAQVTITSLTVDSVTNLPCGLSYVQSPANGILTSGATGCIRIFGTTYDNVGQYRANIYVTLVGEADLGLITLPLNFDGEAASVVAQIENAVGQSLGVDFNYYIRVKATASDPCPAIDNSGNNNLTASPACVPPSTLAVDITGPTEACAGDSVWLGFDSPTAVTPLNSVLWSTGETDDSIRVAAGASVTLEIIDAVSDTGNAAFSVGLLTAPTAAFTVAQSADTVTVTDASTGGATSISWDFAGEGTGSGSVESFAFGANGSYDITLTATNDCGSTDTTITVTIAGVGIAASLQNELRSKIYPNPGKGTFYVQLGANFEQATTVTVLNIQGQTIDVVTAETVSGNNVIELDLNGVAAGVYLVKIENEEGSAVQRLSVQQ